MRSTSPLLLTFTALLLTTLPCPAPVTVLPEATPKAKPKPKAESKPPARSSSPPVPDASSLAGTWQGSVSNSGTTRLNGKDYFQTSTQPHTLAIDARGSVSGIAGVFSWVHPNGVPKPFLTRGSQPGGPLGPYPTRRSGSRLEWSYRSLNGSTINASLSARSGGSTATYRTSVVHPAGTRITGTATLTRVH